MSLALSTGLLLAYSGMLGLCLGLERHFKQVWQRVPSLMLRRVLRVGGWLALLASSSPGVCSRHCMARTVSARYQRGRAVCCRSRQAW